MSVHRAAVVVVAVVEVMVVEVMVLVLVVLVLVAVVESLTHDPHKFGQVCLNRRAVATTN